MAYIRVFYIKNNTFCICIYFDRIINMNPLAVKKKKKIYVYLKKYIFNLTLGVDKQSTLGQIIYPHTLLHYILYHNHSQDVCIGKMIFFKDHISRVLLSLFNTIT